jgi:hypothetical protein
MTPAPTGAARGGGCMTDHVMYRKGLAQCLRDCAITPGFVDEFNAITGLQFGLDSAPDSVDAQAFAVVVDAYIWRPMWQQYLRQAERS